MCLCEKGVEGGEEATKSLQYQLVVASLYQHRMETKGKSTPALGLLVDGKVVNELQFCYMQTNIYERVGEVNCLPC